ncbi:CLUMA_CG003182, isoform D [Clunio marinus]|uniref:CLUMA_CG003182, isoform D n=1 Tax=Clunio marinus TaxID=568069 RepID=A0A1J1HPW5_9DIPT|nr:CLUMA_CG003182, isoform D [Clunio marinus]
MAAEDLNAYKIASHSKSTTKSRFWNRSFHILSCDQRMKSSVRRAHSCCVRTSIALNNSNNSGIYSSRLDRKLKGVLEDFRWNQFNWQQSFLVILIVVLLNFTSIECLQSRQEASSNCVFPQQWEGSWFQSGVPQTIDIQGSTMSNRGSCIASDGDKFLMREKRCHRCVVIYEKHKNVLQYKESMGCRGRETLQNLCDQIPGDALLYSMFKVDAEPIKCPIRGPFTFTYNRGHGECKNPVSNIDSCTEDSRMLLSFQACPDVQGTESTVEELTCLAAWKDGNARYLVGLVSHNHATSNEERFRCFVYEKINTNNGKYGGSPKDAEYKLAQSGDATCNGLESAEVGSRIMTLKKAPPVVRCDFPSWFKNQRHWHTLSGSLAYTFHQNDGSMHIVKQNGYLETRVLCEQINKQTAVEMMAVVHHAMGCKSGFVCVMFYRRNAHVAELQMGTPANRLEDACAADHFDQLRLPFITLLASNPESEICPLDGSYSLRGTISPPYISSSRHKRNHNSKLHNNHHHLHDLSSSDGRITNNNFKAHTSLSFRNEEDSLKSWHFNDRNKSLRQRRSLQHLRNGKDEQSSETDRRGELIANPSSGAYNDIADDGSDVLNIHDDDNDKVIKLVRNKRNTNNFINNSNNNNNINNNNNPSLEIVTDLVSLVTIKSNINDPSRSRRDATINCGVNVNTKSRQLNIGCFDENKIDVSPQCNDDIEEEYTCHGSWRENQTTFIIARQTGTKHGVCISFKQSTTDTAQLYIGESCYRDHQGLNISLERQYTLANLTNVGRKCGDHSSSIKTTANWLLICLLLPWWLMIVHSTR